MPYKYKDLGHGWQKIKTNFHFTGDLICTDLSFDCSPENARDMTLFIHLYSTLYDIYILVIRDMNKSQVYMCETKEEIITRVENTCTFASGYRVKQFCDNIDKLFADE